jgi:hypothetical protein
MKRYVVETEMEMSGLTERIYVEAYDGPGAIEQVQAAYKGAAYPVTVISATELKRLATPLPSIQELFVSSQRDKTYWKYVQDNIECYDNIRGLAIARAFEHLVGLGHYDAPTLEAMATLIEQVIEEHIALEG